MSDRNITVRIPHIGYLELLFPIFLTLKLAHIITWSCWLVCLPLYGPAILILALLAVTVLFVWLLEKV